MAQLSAEQAGKHTDHKDQQERQAEVDEPSNTVDDGWLLWKIRRRHATPVAKQQRTVTALRPSSGPSSGEWRHRRHVHLAGFRTARGARSRAGREDEASTTTAARPASLVVGVVGVVGALGLDPDVGAAAQPVPWQRVLRADNRVGGGGVLEHGQQAGIKGGVVRGGNAQADQGRGHDPWGLAHGARIGLSNRPERSPSDRLPA
ncbi:MAG: hypothetical protein M3235_13385 [Actinomycetota bacterium]|nr:hypothetical protein [Actinomycetota bacterium]